MGWGDRKSYLMTTSARCHCSESDIVRPELWLLFRHVPGTGENQPQKMKAHGGVACARTIERSHGMTCYEYRHGTMERRWRRAMMKPKFRDRVYGPRGGQYSVAILVIKKKRSTRRASPGPRAHHQAGQTHLHAPPSVNMLTSWKMTCTWK
jgi:hypothetical protein